MGYYLIPIFDDERTNQDDERRASYCRSCKHRDCEEVRQLRKNKCPYCNKGFEANDRVCDIDGKTYHFICAIEKAEKSD